MLQISLNTLNKAAMASQGARMTPALQKMAVIAFDVRSSIVEIDADVAKKAITEINGLEDCPFAASVVKELSTVLGYTYAA